MCYAVGVGSSGKVWCFFFAFFAFFAFFGLGGAEQLFFCSYFPHFTRQEILDCMAHCSIIRDFMVVLKNAPKSCVSRLKQGPGSEALGGWHLFIL